MSALIRYHITQLRRSPATGVLLAAGWVALVLLTFVHGRFMAANQANLTLFFAYLPWVMAVLIAALAMPMASEPARSVTERLATLPFTTLQRVSARFQVYWLLVGLWLVGFAPLVGTLYYWGAPDTGTILTGTLGSWLLAAPMLALAMLVCRRAGSAVSGLMLSLSANLLLLLPGTAWVGGWLAQVPGLGWLPGAGHLTLLGAFQPFTQGVVNLAAVLVILAFTLLALAPQLGPRGRWGAGGLGAVLLAWAMVPSMAWQQLDATSESLHTPAPTTVRMFQRQGVPVTFTLHVSSNNPDIPPATHQAIRSLTNLLLNLRAQAPTQVVVRQNNTDASVAAAIRALQAGATEQPLPTGTGYFAALEVNLGGNTAILPTIQPQRQPVQEYDIVRLVQQAQANALPQVGVLGNAAGWQAALAPAFTFVPLSGAQPIPPGLGVIVLAQDVPLSQTLQDNLTTHLANGGGVLLLADSFSRTYPQTSPEGIPFSNLLPQWGISLTSGAVVADSAHATLVRQPGTGAMPYPFWLSLSSSNFNPKIPFVQGQGGVRMHEAARLIPLPQPPEGAPTFTPIITASPQARLVPLAAFLGAEPAQANALLPTAIPAPGAVLGGMLTGRFGPEAPAEATLMVMADTDWLTPQALTDSPANLTLLSNMLHTLAGQHALASLRAKGATPRSLIRIESMAAHLAAQSAQTEADMATRLRDINPAAQEEAFTLRQQLRDIRAQARHRLLMQENALLLLNLLLSPLLLGLALLVQHLRHKRLANNPAPY